tara:strand:+ start:29 stop:592 length:564 start_codon:yes stop_codon:yes gene_type:complete
MTQLSLNIGIDSEFEIIASSAFNFRIELIKKVGEKDLEELIEISKELKQKHGEELLITKDNIYKYFNNNTLPFIARYNNKIIGYIIGTPLESFNNESWAHYDSNLGKNNTLYTYAFVLKSQFRKKGGYAKSLKLIYLNWAKKNNYQFVSGHVRRGISKRFSKNTSIIKNFSNWNGLNTAFEYYRRPL